MTRRQTYLSQRETTRLLDHLRVNVSVAPCSAAVLAVLPELMQALRTSSMIEVQSFLATPLGTLNGATPRAALEAGQRASVLLVAEWVE